jgi:phosphoglucomutase
MAGMQVFDFEMIKTFVARKDFSMVFDALHAISGAYSKPLFVDRLGCDPSVLHNAVPKEDFGGGHPDPNLTYAKELVDIMWADGGPCFGAASDGDGDRNMILGSKFFITPSDSVAMIAANAQVCVPLDSSCLLFQKQAVWGTGQKTQIQQRHTSSNGITSPGTKHEYQPFIFRTKEQWFCLHV